MTPVSAKVLEQFPVQWAREKNKNPDVSQFGGIKGSNTTFALIKTLQPVFDGTDNNKYYARILLVDFSKAFDHIDHETVLKKLHNNGVDNILIQWFRGFLTDRKQRVVVGEHSSEWKSVSGGVPQGTLSGPELFVNMVSDMNPELPTIKYVDDTTIIEVLQRDQPSQMQSTIDWLVQWCDHNFMSINAAKTVEIRVDFGKEKVQVPQLHVGDNTIKVAPSAKLLGVIISHDLKWDKHADHIYMKASQRLQYLRILHRCGLTQDQLRQVYITLIRPILEYASQVWTTGLSSESSKLLESIQKRACRIICPGKNYKDALEQTKLESLYDCRIHKCKDLFQQMQNSHHKLHSMLPKKKVCHYSTRNPSQYPLPKCKTNRTKNSFVPWCLFHCQ